MLLTWSSAIVLAWNELGTYVTGPGLPVCLTTQRDVVHYVVRWGRRMAYLPGLCTLKYLRMHSEALLEVVAKRDDPRTILCCLSISILHILP